MDNLKNIPYRKWSEMFEGLGLKKYAALQVYQWLFKKGVTSFDEMTNLSNDARKILADNYYIGRAKIVDTLVDPDDGTKKFLFELEDGERIESVMIPVIDDAAETQRLTLCISSQVGCALGCLFCRTAGIGFIRNLTTSEIVDQVLEVKRHLGRAEALDPPVKPEDDVRSTTTITNIVFMGMGEPLNNYENVREALSILISKNGLKLAKRRITISTAGVVPGIQRMAIDDLGVKLAISLNATTDDVRRKIMPIAKTYTIDETIEACRDYRPAGDRWRTTFEYVMIDGLNDTPADMKRLLKLMRRLPSKVNLIPFNPFPGSEYKAPKEEVLKEFSNYLYNNGIHSNVRKSRGQKILAACGQLAGRKNSP